MSEKILDPNRDSTESENKPEYPTVGDAEDIAQKRSHQRVQALLDEITNTRVRAANDVAGEVSPADHRRAYHEVVKELWTELRPTLANATDDTEEYYWHQVDLGKFIVEPPKPLQEPDSRHEAERRPDLQPGASWATPEQYNVTGFEQFAQMDVVVRARFSVRFDEDSITKGELERRINRADPNGTYDVWPRSGGDFEEPFRADKVTLLPEFIINNARSALRELAEKSGQGFGKPDHVDDEELNPV